MAERGDVAPPVPDADAPTAKLAQLVAERMVEEILERGWPVNESLGAEPELMSRYGVSRAVLREAIRLVEHMGIATMRRGPRGGLIVTASSVSAVTDAIAIFLEAEAVQLDDLAEARVVLELTAVRLAADRLDTAGTESLLTASMDHEGRLPSGEPDLHLTIAAATGNQALLLFIDALSRLERRYMMAGWGEDHRERVSVATSLAQSHRAIADAVISGDGLLARHRMLTHIETVGRFVRRYATDPGDEADWPPESPEAADGEMPASLERGVSAVSSEGRKLGEVTAARIRRDIARQRAGIGTNLGSESALLATYGVSRSVLREAVRLLEYHSLARMRRGPGGGLIVVKPDPEAVIRAVSLYLQSVQVDIHSLYEVRDAIELASVGYAVERLEPEGEAYLREILEREVIGPDSREALGVPNIHAAIAELTGNRILSLFTRILLALTSGWILDSSGGDSGIDRRVSETHAGIVEAILAGDPALARRRARVHLWELEQLQSPSGSGGNGAPPGDRPSHPGSGGSSWTRTPFPRRPPLPAGGGAVAADPFGGAPALET